MFEWLKSLFCKPIEKPKKRPRLYKQAVVVTKGELPKPVKKAPAKKVAVKKPVKKAKK